VSPSEALSCEAIVPGLATLTVAGFGLVVVDAAPTGRNSGCLVRAGPVVVDDEEPPTIYPHSMLEHKGARSRKHAHTDIRAHTDTLT